MWPTSGTSAIRTPSGARPGSTPPCSRLSSATASRCASTTSPTVHLALATASRTTFQMAYLVTRDDEVAATAVTVHGMVTSAGRPIRLPAWLVEMGAS